MSKVDRKALERGKKLVREHVFDPLSAAVTDLNTVAIEREQLEAQWAPFRLNYSIPYLAADMNSTSHSIPFVLPPLQDSMAISSTSKAYTDRAGAPQTTVELESDTTSTTTEIFLDEVSFGFDQRDAPAAIASQFSGQTTLDGNSPNQGKLCYDSIGEYDIGLSIYEKDPLFFVPAGDRTAEHELTRREVWSASLSHTGFANDVFALNPYVVGDINEQIDPWKSYVFTISAPKIGIHAANAPTQAALVSIEVSLKFRARIMKRNDRASWAPENAPTSALTRESRTAAGNPVSITVPAEGSKITADASPTGVSTSIAAVDEAFRGKLHAGFSRDSEAGETIKAISEELESDAAYEVLTVPLFQNSTTGGINTRVATEQPYGAEAGGVSDTVLIDRRIIPINYPFQIEHVIVALNFQRFHGFGASSGTTFSGDRHPLFGGEVYEYDFGVGIGTGIQADDFDYAQIARSAAGTPFIPGVSTPDYVIDKIRSGPRRFLPLLTASTRAHNLELWCLPLTKAGAAATEPAYFYDSSQPSTIGLQSKPYFVGRSWTATQTRTDPLPGVSGKEQWIEVRGRISSLNSATNTLVVGYQGIFVYIIGRKFLTS